MSLWGRYWGWDPKETWAYVSIVVYALVIHLRFVKSLNTPYVLATASLLAFSSIMMTYSRSKLLLIWNALLCNR